MMSRPVKIRWSALIAPAFRPAPPRPVPSCIVPSFTSFVYPHPSSHHKKQDTFRSPTRSSLGSLTPFQFEGQADWRCLFEQGSRETDSKKCGFALSQWHEEKRKQVDFASPGICPAGNNMFGKKKWWYIAWKEMPQPQQTYFIDLISLLRRIPRLNSRKRVRGASAKK
jgi:hypothetical protein